MDCRDVFPRMNARLDGELSAPEAAAIDRHLVECGECTRQQALLQASRDAFRVLMPEAAPRGFDAAIFRRIQGGASVRRWLTAAAAVAAVSLLLVGERPSPGRVEPPTRTQLASTAGRDDGTERPGLDCGLAEAAAACRADAPCGDGLCTASAAMVSKRPLLAF